MGIYDAAPDHSRLFEKQSVIRCTLDELWQFHQASDAIKTITPPPVFVQVHQDRRVSLTEGDLVFTLWLLFLPVRWVARHEAGTTAHSFVDVMVDGPMAYWRHEHILEPVAEGVRLTDRIRLAHRDGWRGLLTRLMFDGLPLWMLFSYRHWRTKMALEGGRASV